MESAHLNRVPDDVNRQTTNNVLMESYDQTQSEIEGRLRQELKTLLGSPMFRSIKDLDEMTDILM